MGRFSHIHYTDSDTEEASSSAESLKKKKKFSLIKYTNGKVKKKMCKFHSLSEPDDMELKTSSKHKIRKLRGILKHNKERELSDKDDDLESTMTSRPKNKYLVGRVPPQSAGSRLSGGCGVAFVIRKNNKGITMWQSLQEQCSTSSTKKRRSSIKGLCRKKSY